MNTANVRDTDAPTPFSFDIRSTPFSRYGSYMALSYLERENLPLGPGLYLRSVHGKGVVRPELFRIAWADGSPIDPGAIEVRAASLMLRYADLGEVQSGLHRRC